LVTYPIVIQYVYRQQVAFGYVSSSDPVCAQTAGRIWSHVTIHTSLFCSSKAFKLFNCPFFIIYKQKVKFGVLTAVTRKLLFTEMFHRVGWYIGTQ